jgi:hypothetical protein
VNDGLGHSVNICTLLPVATVASITGEPLTVATEDDTLSSSKIYSCNYTNAAGTSGLIVTVEAMVAAICLRRRPVSHESGRYRQADQRARRQGVLRPTRPGGPLRQRLDQSVGPAVGRRRRNIDSNPAAEALIEFVRGA